MADLLGGAELVTTGDAPAPRPGSPGGDKSRFVRGVEQMLLNGEAEVGVHSAKDLPSEMAGELSIAGVPPREDPSDAWVGAGSSLDEIAEGSRVGTSSLRRRAQLLVLRPDLEVVELHGNVDTRLRKLRESDLDAIVLAAAGLRRLGRDGEIAFLLEPELMTPAAGQGALALQTRGDDAESRAAAARISDETALMEVTAERAVVAGLDASCNTPIGIHASRDGARLAVEAFVGLPDGSEWLRERVEGEAERPVELGTELAGELVGAGAVQLLERAEALA